MKTESKKKRLAFLNEARQEILGFSIAPGDAREIRVARCDSSRELLPVPAQLRLDEAPGTLKTGSRFEAGQDYGQGIIIAEYEGLRAELLVLVNDPDARAALFIDPVI